MSSLLVVDDEQAICWGITRLGRALGHDVHTASSAEEGLELADRIEPDAIVLDVRLPGMDGLTAIDHFRRRLGPVPIIVITAYGDLPTAVSALHQGAFEYLVKPFDLQQVQAALQRAIQHQPARESEPLTGQRVEGLVGTSSMMQEVFKRIALAATADANVLLTGESGTGKELAARAIHKFSRRSQGPLVAVNVASLSPSLAESELFGHVRGAFTGAEEPRLGLLAQAHGGTLFLDEVADIPLPIQVKLLRAIEDGGVVPVGSNEPIASDFRLVSATHQDLLRMVEQGTFRHDLYFRLCSFRVDLPPLRERREDIVPLAEHFLSLLVPAAAQVRPRLSAEVRHQLQQRPWHGNVRELRNALEHALVLARGGTLLPEHLPPAVAAPGHESAGGSRQRIEDLVSDWALAQLSDQQSAGELYEELLKVIEPPLLKETLRHSGGQYVAAARRLGLHRSTLKKKLDRYGMGSGDHSE